MARPPHAREKILAAARHIVEREGAGALTFDELVRQSGITRGGITYHFPTKEDLLRGLLEADFQQWDDAEAAHTPSDCDADTARLLGFIRTLTAQDESHRRFLCGMLSAATLDPSLMDPCRKELRERLSVGIVIGRDEMARLGATPVERLACVIETDPYLKRIVGPGRRVTPAATYTNYQLVSRRGLGAGWVSAGDAFGHVDPMLSPGLYLGMHSAELIADALAPFLRRATPPASAVAAALDRYARAQRHELEAWVDLIAYLYDGRLAAMIRAGRDWIQSGPPSRFKTAAQNHIERQIALRASAMRTSSRYCSGLMRLLGSRGLRGVDPAPFAIR